MNSTTSDYTEMNRTSLENNFHYRCSLSSVKKKPYLPRKILKLAPLNLKEIKKELEEADRNGDSESKYSSEREPKDVKDSAEKVLKDISNHLQEKFDDISEISMENENKTSLSVIMKPDVELQKENEVISSGTSTSSQDNHCSDSTHAHVVFKSQNNDSFDMDFSALSLKTPVKAVERTCSTPIVCQDSETAKFNKQGTVSVNQKLGMKQKYLEKYSMPKNQFVTPINLMRKSSAKFSTPYLDNMKNISESAKKNIVCSIPKTVPKDETFNKIVVNNIEYLILSLLGKGGSSEVYQCFCLGKKLLVAIKSVNLQDEASAEGYINEVKLLQQLQNCDKIITMYDFEIVESQKKLYMVLERGGDDLSTILKKLSLQSSHLPWFTLLFYWMNMLHAVQQIHSHGVIHSDLKPANFINTDNGLKLIDFGIASSVQNDETSVIKTRSEGSCNYISPEALNCDTSGPNFRQGRYKVHFKSDVWSLGCILYQLVYGKTPFHQFTTLWSKLAYILDPNHKIQYPDADGVPPKFLNTIRHCLRYDVKARPSVEQLIGECEQILHNL
ncbi:unnamed protein product [Phaedon cochleariae]|uniref:Protein kinase domain-containing protein n=1 Tax=Phaedon cochleariae TaxID=80249 RepID=A0A9P0DEB3_PHACE|nr:unnamed protein product [Phaedon cochleariae]